MVYGRPPFANLPMVQKLRCIVDDSFEIQYGPTPTHDPSLIEVMKGCLVRDPKRRMTIPQLLSHRFLHPVGSLDSVSDHGNMK